MDRINWDVVWSTGRTLLIAGGSTSTLLIALGFPPVQVNAWMGFGLAIIGVASIVVPGIIGALKRTDTAKVVDAAQVPGVTITVDPLAASTPVLTAALEPTNPVKVASP